ncbi:MULTISPECIES: GNAT family N-acetyltransferase [unclassified Kitasatospora]|uniref:GNAT family N-acetyltransferase n=1 Tax=unclassified Kitasatospora TaxID=2633591 RepID=UPI0024747198|nr:GNAT family N-acetyltransferase [Kitasatospora sp. MAP12-44]
MDDLVTTRLLLHPMSITEAEHVVAGVPGDSDRWADGYPSAGVLAGARGFLSTCAAAGGDPRPFGAYQLLRREDGLAIGGLGFHGAPDEDGCVAIGYGLIPSAHGQGYASEAVRALLALARAHDITAVTGNTTHDNVPSQRVMTAVGMQLVEDDGRLKHYRISMR